jgi:hypothetical protein
MVKVLVVGFHEELPIPPLVKEKKEESSHGQKYGKDQGTKRKQ